MLSCRRRLATRQAAGALLGLLLGACRAGVASSSPDAVASFRGGEILRAELERTAPPQRTPHAADPTEPRGDWRTEALETLALRKVLAPEAVASNALAERIHEVRKMLLGTAQSRELGWDALAVTEPEIRAEYDSHPELYHDPEKIRFQHIFFRAEAEEMKPEDRALVRQRLEGLRKEILAGADFGAMAKEYSQSATAPSGGWSGLKRGERASPAFVETAWKLRIEQVSPVVDTPNGFHIIKLKTKVPPLDRKFEDVKEFARNRVLTAKRAEKQQAFVEEAGKRFGLVKNYALLDDPMVKDDAPLIVVGKTTFTMRTLAARLPQNLSEHLYNGFFSTIHRFLDGLALEELLFLEAERRGIAERPEMADRIRIATEEVRSQAAFEERLKRKVAALPEKELREFYKQNEKRYQKLRTFDVDVILLKPEPGESPWRMLKRGESLAARVRKGEDFGALARSASHHYSARDGGRMPGLTDLDIEAKVQSTARFRRVLDGLSVGEVGQPIVAECYDPERLRFASTGVIIVRLAGTHPAVPQPFEQVRDQVEANYLRRNSQRLEAETKKAVLESVAFRVHPERLPPL